MVRDSFGWLLLQLVVRHFWGLYAFDIFREMLPEKSTWHINQLVYFGDSIIIQSTKRPQRQIWRTKHGASAGSPVTINSPLMDKDYSVV